MGSYERLEQRHKPSDLAAMIHRGLDKGRDPVFVDVTNNPETAQKFLNNIPENSINPIPYRTLSLAPKGHYHFEKDSSLKITYIVLTNPKARI